MNPTDIIDESWNPIKSLLFQSPLKELNEEVLGQVKCYPEKENIFRVFRMPLNKIRVVILGQDPYHGPGQASGLCFAVNSDVKVPPSLRIIQKEVFKDSPDLLKVMPTMDTNWKTLEHWEDQGVFLLNTALTVEASKPGSHLKYWENFIKRVVFYITSNHQAVWLLWGKKAQSFTSVMDSKRIYNANPYKGDLIKDIPIHPDYNYLLSASHPAAELYSGGNGGFSGCNHFAYANEILKRQGKKQIIW